MEKLGETSEDEEEELDIDVKEEDDDDEEDDGDDDDMAQGGGGRGAYGRSMLVGEGFGNSRGNSSFLHHHHQQQQHPQLVGGDADQQQMMMMMLTGAGGSGGMRRCRPKEEKERTKLRERHRRAITARILSGLRRHGNYNLRVRADINEVIAALAREAGWTVLPDGTTFPTRPTISHPQMLDAHHRMLERDFAGSPYVPVYVMLPLGIINMKCELMDPDGVMKQLRILKSVNVDGVMVDCWWGIVEAHAPQEYNWHGYKQLFQIVRELKLKLQVVMSFHECGGNVGDDVCIPLPHWVAEIGRSNPDIFFTDREGRCNSECLTWGIDKERVLRGRTAVELD